MFKPNTPTCAQKFIHQQPLIIGEEFGVLCWNTQKTTQTNNFLLTLAQLLDKFPANFLLLQEAKLTIADEWQLQNWSYALAPNIQTKQLLFGVLTASKTAFSEANPELSLKKEMGLATHKSYMLSKHPLSNGQTLLIVNVHAINFVSSQYFLQEILLLEDKIRNHQGPLIVAGDFNVWNRKRRLYLRKFSRKLGLKQAYLSDAQNVKSYLNNPLDFILYRDLLLKEARAIKTKISDHNPIYASFIV